MVSRAVYCVPRQLVSGACIDFGYPGRAVPGAPMGFRPDTCSFGMKPKLIISGQTKLLLKRIRAAYTIISETSKQLYFRSGSGGAVTTEHNPYPERLVRIHENDNRKIEPESSRSHMHMATKPRVPSTSGGVEGEQSERRIKLITEYLFESHLTHATPRQNVDRIETATSSLDPHLCANFE
jgi:hypothetical protein